MLHYGQKFNKEGNNLNVIYTGNSIDVGVKQLEDKKYVLFAQVDIYERGLYILKGKLIIDGTLDIECNY